MSKRLIAAAAGVAAFCAAPPALAVTSADILRGSLYNGLIDRGIELLEPLAESGDTEARFGVGMLRFVGSIEGLLNAVYRHGMAMPQTGVIGVPLPEPLPRNSDPEPIDYEGVRAVLETFVADLDAAKAELLEAGESGDYVIKLDPTRFRVDIDGDGRASASESIGAIISAAIGTPLPDMAQLQREGAGGVKIKPIPNKDGSMPVIGIGFDRADALWLAGYSTILASQFDFMLAHDFSEFLGAVGHRIFPDSTFALTGTGATGTLMMDPESDTAIADAIAAIHTLNWPVTDAARLRGVLARAQEVVGLSRRNWEAILAETDDDMELIPSPTQTPQLQGPDGAITADMVAAWQATLDTTEQILNGELLLPHWRFSRGGFDLKAYFETATRTDLVMILTGYGALPFMKDGPVVDAETFAEADRVFGGNLLGYAFWFN